MAKTIKEEKLMWVLPVINKEIKLVDITQVCLCDKHSLESWVTLYKEKGEIGLEPKSTEPNTQTEETPIWKKASIDFLKNFLF